jgi:hypothetical protein
LLLLMGDAELKHHAMTLLDWQVLAGKEEV